MIAVFAAITGCILIAPTGAKAQSVLDQYIPSIKPSGTGSGPADPRETSIVPGSAGGKTAGALASDAPDRHQGEGASTSSVVPGTDYPLIPFLVGALIALGVVTGGIMVFRTRGAPQG